MCTHEDVTERKHAEQELARTKKFVDTVIENVPVAILVRHPETLPLSSWSTVLRSNFSASIAQCHRQDGL